MGFVASPPSLAHPIPTSGARHTEVMTCPGVSYMPCGTISSHDTAVHVQIRVQCLHAQAGRVGKMMASRGALSMGLGHAGRCLGENLPNRPCGAMYDVVFNIFHLSINR